MNKIRMHEILDRIRLLALQIPHKPDHEQLDLVEEFEKCIKELDSIPNNKELETVKYWVTETFKTVCQAKNADDPDKFIDANGNSVKGFDDPSAVGKVGKLCDAITMSPLHLSFIIDEYIEKYNL